MKVLLDRFNCILKIAGAKINPHDNIIIETIQKERNTWEKMITVSEIFATILHGWPYIVIRVPVGEEDKNNAWNYNGWRCSKTDENYKTTDPRNEQIWGKITQRKQYQITENQQWRESLKRALRCMWPPQGMTPRPRARNHILRCLPEAQEIRSQPQVQITARPLTSSAVLSKGLDVFKPQFLLIKWD